MAENILKKKSVKLDVDNDVNIKMFYCKELA